MNHELLQPDVIAANVRSALAEDIGSGDVTAHLVPAGQHAHAHVVTRERATVCGRAWVDEVFRQVDPEVVLTWHCADGEAVDPGKVLFDAAGRARSLLSAERTALNFLQLLSGTATRCRHFADIVAGLPTKLLDTRKTIPGLRLAQKYAVRCGWTRQDAGRFGLSQVRGALIRCISDRIVCVFMHSYLTNQAHGHIVCAMK
ncbi:MAG: hypothetical protein CALGDGBN_02636 [Pseudomonadales bacterium]|nr:hypothetical protein [Pseudomonadales bacterium]